MDLCPDMSYPPNQEPPTPQCSCVPMVICQKSPTTDAAVHHRCERLSKDVSRFNGCLPNTLALVALGPRWTPSSCCHFPWIEHQCRRAPEQAGLPGTGVEQGRQNWRATLGEFCLFGGEGFFSCFCKSTSHSRLEKCWGPRWCNRCRL